MDMDVSTTGLSSQGHPFGRYRRAPNSLILRNGRADILVVPDLESGNMLAKQLEYLGEALLAAVVAGASVPIVLTSRADTAETRAASCAIALLMADATRKQAA